MNRDPFSYLNRPVHEIVEKKVELRTISQPGFILGLDLGKSQDFTALTVDEVTECEKLILERTTFAPDFGVRRRYRVKRHSIVNLHRYPIGTSYPEIGRAIGSVLRQLPARKERPELVVDRTGVGAPVVNLLREMDLNPIAVAITAGLSANSGDHYNWTVPKPVLASTLDAVLADDRLDITAQSQFSEALKAELGGFHAKVRPSGSTSFEAWREGVHDDLVLALAMAVWRGENQPVRPQWVQFSLHDRGSGSIRW